MLPEQAADHLLGTFKSQPSLVAKSGSTIGGWSSLSSPPASNVLASDKDCLIAARNNSPSSINFCSRLAILVCELLIWAMSLMLSWRWSRLSPTRLAMTQSCSANFYSRSWTCPLREWTFSSRTLICPSCEVCMITALFTQCITSSTYQNQISEKQIRSTV